MQVLEILVMPLVLLSLGFIVPRQLEHVRRKRFLCIIEREILEMRPEEGEAANWTARLTKRFLHQEIFEHVSENRDFILSLRPSLAYHLSQMWIAFAKAKESTANDDLKRQGLIFVGCLRNICDHLDPGGEAEVHKVYEKWLKFHPEAKPADT